jgi:hypothetical protein
MTSTEAAASEADDNKEIVLSGAFPTAQISPNWKSSEPVAA